MIGAGEVRMASGDLRTGLRQLRRALAASGAGLTDGELLGRFVAARDEAAFEALVYRHGPMVLGLCRRVLGNAHDAEDAFQATFLILARKASSVVKRDSVGTWLYAVAQRTAQEARTVLARRRARERQMAQVPHPEVPPAEPEDWRPLLDREVARLPRKYQDAVVLFYLEGWPFREAASKLGVPLGTLSSRLAKARRLLAKRLARIGLSLSATALASVLSEGIAPAAVPPSLVRQTVRGAAGQVSAVAPPVALLTKGVLKIMFLSKLKFALGMLLTVAVLGATGLAYRAGAQALPQASNPPQPRVEKPRSELEALRRENELLKLNLEVVLEKVKAQEAELRALRGTGGRVEEWRKAADLLERARALDALNQAKETADAQARALNYLKRAQGAATDQAKREWLNAVEGTKKRASDGAIKQLEDTLSALRAAPKFEGQQQAVEALEKALRQLKEQPKPSKQ
jgi:RNA polymerase sigma factor (sigma-70 family)